MRAATLAVGSTFLGISFGLGPFTSVALNGALDWPRLESAGARTTGIALIVGGLVATAWCADLFRRVGLGTPVPVEPPERLVVSGLYRYSRNPIYVAYVTILVGLFLVRGELALLLYSALFAGAMHLAILRMEEPILRRRFGTDYERYTREVPRWLGRRRWR